MTLADLPKIQIIRNVRSTRLRLRVEPHQIRLSAPVFCTKSQIQKFIDQSESWLLATWKKQQDQVIQNSEPKVLPTELKLFNQNLPLQIFYTTQKQNFILNIDALRLSVSDRQPEVYLKAFVIQYAKDHLPNYLRQISKECDLPFGQCAIRQPKTRWGSCTAKHNIMLNSGLVLFPQEIVRYVAVHELAHTQHFDHSQNFWTEVAKHDVNYQQHRKIVKTTLMPYWWI